MTGLFHSDKRKIYLPNGYRFTVCARGRRALFVDSNSGNCSEGRVLRQFGKAKTPQVAKNETHHAKATSQKQPICGANRPVFVPAPSPVQDDVGYPRPSSSSSKTRSRRRTSSTDEDDARQNNFDAALPSRLARNGNDRNFKKLRFGFVLFDVFQPFGNKTCRIFMNEAFKGFLLFLPKRFNGVSLDNAAFELGAEQVGKKRCISYNAKGDFGVFGNMVDFAPIRGAVKIDASVNQAIIQRNPVWLVALG